MSEDFRMNEDRLGVSDDEAPKRRGRPPKESNHLAGDRRVEREDEDREVLEDRELSDDDRVEMFMGTHYNTVLPDLPRMPGYHVFWATTQNPRDTIHHRMMLGYELIRLEHVPGWQGISLKTGDYAGCIGINEMVAMRIPLRLYNRYMNAAHHEMPMRDEENLRSRVDLMKRGLEDRGARVSEEGDGTAEIVQRARPMQFSH